MSTCPISVAPGQIIGFVNGRPVRAIAGGSEPVVTPPAAPAAPAAPVVTPPAAVVPPVVTPPVVTPPAAAEETVEALPAWAQKLIGDVRKEAGDHRAAKNAETERIKAILTAAGIQTEDEDPVKVLESTRAANETLESQVYQLTVERAMANACRRAGADEDLVTAVLAHQGKLDDFDVAAADFTTKLDALVKATVDSNPKLKGGLAPSASGIPTPGGPGPAADIDAAIEAAQKAGRTGDVIRLRRAKAYASRA